MLTSGLGAGAARLPPGTRLDTGTQSSASRLGPRTGMQSSRRRGSTPGNLERPTFPSRLTPTQIKARLLGGESSLRQAQRRRIHIRIRIQRRRSRPRRPRRPRQCSRRRLARW